MFMRCAVYDLRGGATDRVCVTLSDVHIDIMDYLVPGACTEAEFRSMWSEFEWENKITINSNFGDISELLRHLERATNMRCITPPKVPALYFFTPNLNLFNALKAYNFWQL